MEEWRCINCDLGTRWSRIFNGKILERRTRQVKKLMEG
jgi:hypothetical protein